MSCACCKSSTARCVRVRRAPLAGHIPPVLLHTCCAVRTHPDRSPAHGSFRCQTLSAAEPSSRGGERTMLRERVHARVTALAVAGLRVHAATSLRRPGLARRRRVSAAARGLPSGPSTPRLAAFVVLVAVRGGAVRRLTAAALHARGQVGPAVTLGGRAGRMAASGAVVGSS